MDFGKALSFTFEDQDWLKKILVGGVVTLVPILNFAAYGYSLEVTRRVINNDLRPLPEWDDLGGKLIKGLLVVVIQFVYALPILLLACLMQVAMMVLGGGASALSSQSSQSGGEAIGGAMLVVMSCFGCLVLLYSILMGIALPAAIGNYAAKDQLGEAFRFGDVMALVQKNIGLYLMVLLSTLVAGLIAGLVGSIACGFGALFTGFWAMLVSGYVTGQAYREASLNIGLV